MSPIRGVILVCSLILGLSFAGCFADEPEEEAPPVVTPPPPPENLTHNVTAYNGQISFQVQPPAGRPVSIRGGDWPSPVMTTTNYTGMVVKLEWAASSAATETMKLVTRPDSDSGDPIEQTGASPLRIPIDMTGAIVRSWFIEVTTDDSTVPVSGAADQSFALTIGQYAGSNGTFDPEWDPVA